MAKYNDMGVEIRERRLIEATMHDFVIFGVVGLGVRKPFIAEGDDDSNKPPKAKFKIIFELPNSVNDEGITDLIHLNMTASTHCKSTYAKLVRVIHGDKAVGRTYTSKQGEKQWELKAEYLNFTAVKGLLGGVGSLTVLHEEGTNGTYAKVDYQSLSVLHPRVARPVGVREPIVFTPMQPDIDVFRDKLTYWTQKEIMEALNVSAFPEELHKAWVAIEENKLKDSEDRPSKTEYNDRDTSAIE
jgi:hypothetical protein